MEVCVAGMCVMRGCGNGLVEVGEECDDGNLLEDDACTASCSSVPVIVAADRSGDVRLTPTRGGRTVAADGAGRLLFVWNEEGFAGGHTLMAQRASRGGVLEGAAVELASTGLRLEPLPVVAGLAGGGWVIAYRGSPGLTTEILVRVVHPDGSLGTMRRAHETAADATGYSEPAIAPVGDGVVVGWTVLWSPSAPSPADVRARRFGPSLLPLGPELAVATSTRDRQEAMAIASHESRWMAVYIDRRIASGATVQLFARRFDSDTPLDGAQFAVTPEPAGTGDVVALGSDTYAVGWMTAGEGELFARVIGPAETTASPTDVLQLTMTPAFETIPSIAWLGGSDYLVGHSLSSSSIQPGGFVTNPGALLPMGAADTLRAALAMSDGYVSVNTVPNGIWVTWVEGLGSAELPQTALGTMFLPRGLP
jgi:cysteine-rich repeat protein